MISGRDYEKIKKELEDTLDDILDSSPQLTQAKEVKAAIDWYGKTKEGTIEPGKILEVINKLMLSKLSDNLSSEFSNILEEKLDGLTIQKTQGGISIKKPLLGFNISTDVVLVANGTVDLGKVTIGLQLNIDFAVENMIINTAGGKKRFEIGKIVFSNYLTLFTKMILRTKSIQIGKKDFELKNIVLET